MATVEEMTLNAANLDQGDFDEEEIADGGCADRGHRICGGSGSGAS
jgi:hypothetical protein